MIEQVDNCTVMIVKGYPLVFFPDGHAAASIRYQQAPRGASHVANG